MLSAFLDRLGKLNLESARAQGLDTLSLLPTVGGPIKKPHPLSYVGSSLMNQSHSEFISSCISANLQLPLWMYCSVHGYVIEQQKYGIHFLSRYMNKIFGMIQFGSLDSLVSRLSAVV